ncbi:hypothetical protein F443_18282 [Phytophthora nicotianae P1569]|uniref:Uncharacterized protein n=1 Tax=Phytophthora nicotianae P1569 TaxID=1317065 RepID=V9E8T4_PHYNI|nr:hypothetical protein F443_18282 [Phytophthora nicotianae P1569]
MSPGDLIFGKPVMLHTYTDKTLVNTEGVEAGLVENAGGVGACVQLVRNYDGTVSIQSMNNKHYLTVADDHDENPTCQFDTCAVNKKSQKFRLKLVDERAFILKSEKTGDLLGLLNDEIVEPTDGVLSSSLCDDLGFTDVTPVQAATVVKSAVQKDDELRKRHDTIVKLALAGASVEYIDGILLRLYGSNSGKEL